MEPAASTPLPHRYGVMQQHLPVFLFPQSSHPVSFHRKHPHNPSNHQNPYNCEEPSVRFLGHKIRFSPDDRHFYIPAVPYAAYDPDRPARPYRNCHHEWFLHDPLHNNIWSFHFLPFHVRLHDHTTPRQTRHTSGHPYESSENNLQNLPVRFPYYGNILPAETVCFRHFSDNPLSPAVTDTSGCKDPNCHNHR